MRVQPSQSKTVAAFNVLGCSTHVDKYEPVNVFQMEVEFVCSKQTKMNGNV